MWFKFLEKDGILFGVGKNMYNELAYPEKEVYRTNDHGIFIPYQTFLDLQEMESEEALTTIEMMMKYSGKYSKETDEYLDRKNKERENPEWHKEEKIIVPGHVYIIITSSGVKIGISNKNGVDNRISSYKTLPLEIKERISYDVLEYRKAERFLHSTFSSKRIAGEWFDLSDEDIKKADQILRDDFKAENIRKVG